MEYLPIECLGLQGKDGTDACIDKRSRGSGKRNRVQAPPMRVSDRNDRNGHSNHRPQNGGVFPGGV